MSKILIETNAPEMIKKLNFLTKNAPKKVSSATNRANKTLIKELTKSSNFKKVYTLKKPADIKKDFRTLRGGGGLTFGTEIKDNKYRLDEFKFKSKVKRIPSNLPNVNKKIKTNAASAKILTNSPLKEIEGAFVRDVSGKKIFKRVGDKRLPVGYLYGPSGAEMMRNPLLREPAVDAARETFDKRINHEFKRMMERK